VAIRFQSDINCCAVVLLILRHECRNVLGAARVYTGSNVMKAL